MKGKILFVTGAAVGYVLGTRAGRKRYEQIKAAADRVWQTPAIQRQVRQAQDYAAQKVSEVPGVILDGVAKAVSAAVQKAAGGSRQVAGGTQTARDAQGRFTTPSDSGQDSESGAEGR